MRPLKGLLATTVMAVASFGATLTVAAPASAAYCMNNGPYSFSTSTNTTYSTIYAYKGSGCSGTYLSYGRATLSGSNVIIYAYDRNCDNVGLKTYTSGGQSVTSTGCGTTASKSVSRSSSGSTYWVEVGGYGSQTHLIPI